MPLHITVYKSRDEDLEAEDSIVVIPVLIVVS
jgi:hypothetical protein